MLRLLVFGNWVRGERLWVKIRSGPAIPSLRRELAHPVAQVGWNWSGASDSVGAVLDAEMACLVGHMPASFFQHRELRYAKPLRELIHRVQKEVGGDDRRLTAFFSQPE
jgi:hypothetical protein